MTAFTIWLLLSLLGVWLNHQFFTKLTPDEPLAILQQYSLTNHRTVSPFTKTKNKKHNNRACTRGRKFYYQITTRNGNTTSKRIEVKR